VFLLGDKASPNQHRKKEMKRKMIVKERNQFVVHALFRKAGAHKRSTRKLARDNDKTGS
jgi:hypothetical protein